MHSYEKKKKLKKNNVKNNNKKKKNVNSNVEFPTSFRNTVSSYSRGSGQEILGDVCRRSKRAEQGISCCIFCSDSSLARREESESWDSSTLRKNAPSRHLHLNLQTICKESLSKSNDLCWVAAFLGERLWRGGVLGWEEESSRREELLCKGSPCSLTTTHDGGHFKDVLLPVSFLLESM